MKFNADKCEVLRISNKRKNHEASYTIYGHILTLTKKAKYLGALLTPNMSWNAHIEMTTRKANNTLAFLRRNLHSCPRATKETCYKSLVRPQLEYASTVWDSHTKSNINALEMVQRRAARFVSGNYRRQASVGAMLQSFGWETLQKRRRQAKVIMMYKIINNLVAIDSLPFLHLQNTATRSHCMRFLQPYCRTQTLRESFFPTAIYI